MQRWNGLELERMRRRLGAGGGEQWLEGLAKPSRASTLPEDSPLAASAHADFLAPPPEAPPALLLV